MKTLVQINHKKEFSLINGISNQLREIVILDPTIPDSHHIASGIKPGTATYILESQPDAVEQITTILAQHTDIEAVHIISHGSSGSLYLRTTELNSSNIENYTNSCNSGETVSHLMPASSYMDVTPQPGTEATNSSLNSTNSPAPTSPPTPTPQATAH
jgi:hypothetical protein